MSFIFGIVNLKGGTINPEDVRKLGKAVRWDDFDSKIEINNSYGWGYCWNKKRQPKAGVYTSERVAVLCDARIYNSDELKQSFEFEQPEEAFAKAYLKWGPGFADKFNGDFAAVIIDFQQQKVLLVRDHIGVRSLTYSVKEDLLIFASHEFGIAKSNLVFNELSDIAIIHEIFPFKKQKYQYTIFQYIKRVVPGHVTVVTVNESKSSRYWHPQKIQTDKTLTFDSAVLLLRQHLINSVQNRIEKGNVGAHVSGGLDSSGVAAILADIIEDKNSLMGYSWSPDFVEAPVEGVNEKEFIEDFIADKGMPVRFLNNIDSEDIDDFICTEFEQMPIEIKTMEQASQDNIVSFFSGWGGDEVVSLGLRGIVNYFIFRLKLIPLLQWIKLKGIKSFITVLMNEVVPAFMPFGLLDYSVYKCFDRIGYFRSEYICKHLRLFFFDHRDNFCGFGSRKKMALRYLHNHHIPQRMDSWMLFGEKYGIEYKFPLLDKSLLDFWFSIPIKLMYKNMIPRILYKEAMAGTLTESIRNRTNKEEALFEYSWVKSYLKTKKKLADKPELFSASSELSFLYASKFYANAIGDTKDIVKIFLELYDMRLFLRYKSLVEKYVVTNPYCMKKQKKNSDSENL